MKTEDKDTLYYALKRVRDNANWWCMSEKSKTRKMCFYMNHEDYNSLLGYTDLSFHLVVYDDGSRTLFGHKIIIRDELKHIYFGVEVNEVNDE